MSVEKELDFLVGRLFNKTGSAEGTNLPPRLIAGRRVPVVSALKTFRAQSYSGGTEFTLTWLDVTDVPNVSGYNIYVTGLLSANAQPSLIATAKRSPAIFRLESNTATQVTFVVQTVLQNGMVSDIDKSPSCTGLTIEPTIDVSDLGPGTAGQLITWDSTGTPTTIGPGASDAILVGSGAGSVPQFKTRATLDLVEGRSNLANANRVAIVSSAGVLTQTSYAHTELVRGAANLTDAGAIPYVSASGILDDDPTVLFWDASNNRLGIGNNNPTSDIEIVTTGSTLPRGVLVTQISGDAQAAFSLFRKARGTRGSEAAINNGDVMGRYDWQGYNGSAYVTAALIRVISKDNFSGTANGAYFQFFVTDATTTTNDERFRISDSGRVRIHGSVAGDPTARLEVQEETLGNEVFRLTSEATNDDPQWRVHQNRQVTTNATVTTLHTVAIPASTTVALRAIVVARRTGGAAGTAEDGARYELKGVYKNVAGTATLIGTVTKLADEDQAAWDTNFTPSGGNVLIEVTGAVDNNITWHLSELDYWPVGS